MLQPLSESICTETPLVSGIYWFSRVLLRPLLIIKWTSEEEHKWLFNTLQARGFLPSFTSEI